jgi:hypothetical protein
MGLGDYMASLLRKLRSGKPMPTRQRHALEGLERVTAPQLETSNYEFMLENLMDLPTDRFDRWRSRTPQG